MTYPDYNGFGDAAPADTDLGDDTAPDEQPDAAAKKPRRKPARPTPTKLTASQVRRVLNQAADIQAQHDHTRELLAAALGTANTVEDLVVGSLNPGKATDIITGLLELREVTGFNAVVEAGALIEDKEAARRVWALLSALGQVAGTIPAKELSAAARIADATVSLSADDIVSLGEVVALIGA